MMNRDRSEAYTNNGNSFYSVNEADRLVLGIFGSHCATTTVLPGQS